MIISKVRDQILLPRLHYYYYKIFYPVRFVANFICILAFTTAVDIRRTVLMLLRGIMSFGHFLTLPSTLSLKKSCLFFHLYFTWLGLAAHVLEGIRLIFCPTFIYSRISARSGPYYIYQYLVIIIIMNSSSPSLQLVSSDLSNCTVIIISSPL